MSSERILIVEDDPVVMSVLQSQLRTHGYEVVGAVSAAAALEEAQTATPDLIILDVNLIDDDPFNSIRDGFGVLGWLRRTLPDATFPVVIHTVDDSPTIDVRARTNGVYGVVRKGADMNQLLAVVRRALDEWKGKATISN